MRGEEGLRMLVQGFRRLSIAHRVATVALAVGALAFGIAWGQQSAAAAALERARALQAQEVGEDDGGPPSLDAYHDILDAIDHSIGIRTGVDALLGEIEEAVTALGEHQELSDRISDRAASDLEEIGRSLDRGASGAESAVEGLGALRRTLASTARLAEAIADELQEIDESLGPSVGFVP